VLERKVCVRFPIRIFFSSLSHPDRLWGPLVLLTSDLRSAWRSFSRLKRLKRQADNLPPFSPWIKNTWRFGSNPSKLLMAWHLFKARENLTFKVYIYWHFIRFLSSSFASHSSSYYTIEFIVFHFLGLIPYLLRMLLLTISQLL
jgi:hypothetical protein